MNRNRLPVALAIAVLAFAVSAAADVHLRTRTLTRADALAPAFAAPAGPRNLVVAARGRVTGEWKHRIIAAGGRLVTYLPDNAFLVRVSGPDAAAVAAVPGTDFAAELTAADKIAPELAAVVAGRAGEPVPVLILVAPDARASDVATRLRELGLEVVAHAEANWFNRIGATLPPGAIDLATSAAEDPDVLWIEPRARHVLLNDTSIWVGQSGLSGGMTTPIFDRGIYGAGQTVAICDTGLDYDMCYFRDPAGPPPVNTLGGTAANPSRRKVVAYDMLYSGDDPADPRAYDNHGHGTHVAGSVGGDNDKTPILHDAGDGMAPAAKLVIQDGGYTTGDNCSDLPGLGCPVIDLTPIFDQAYQQGARFHSNSWGDRENYTPQNTYTAACLDSDDFMYTHPDFLLLYAAGNSGPGNNTVGSPSVAKDVVSVGATQRAAAADTIASFSSRCCAADGRQKPTLTAPGVSILSARNDKDIRTGNCATASSSGTSMACPTAAGYSALVAEYYATGFYPSGIRTPADGFTPSAALVKATLVNSGRAMANEAPMPGRSQGWGRVTLGDTLVFPGGGRDLFVADEKIGFPTGATAPLTYTVSVNSSQPLKATLVWTDPPSNPLASKNLINDLDLTVSGPSGTFLGNVFASGASTTGGAPDRLNVEEQVRIASPLPGDYTVTVAPFAVPMGPQPFALVLTGDMPSPILIGYESMAVAQDENSNGWADPGERLRLAFTLSSRSAKGVALTGVLRSLSTDVVVTDPTAAWADLAPGASGTSLPDHFEILVSPAAVCGKAIPLKLTVTASGKDFEFDVPLLVGGLVPIYGQNFDSLAPGTLPGGWTVSSDRPGIGNAYATATVEPSATSPGPVSRPNALFIGKDGTDSIPTLTDVVFPVDLSLYSGRTAVLALRCWAYSAEAGETLTVSVSDSGPSSFNWKVFQTPAPFDSATGGGNLWGSVAVDLSTLPGFSAGRDVWVRLETTLDSAVSGATGDGFYVDDVEVRAVACMAAGCTAVTADPSATPTQPVCPNTAVTLDGSRSKAGAGCTSLDYTWYEGSTQIATGAMATVVPLATTVYGLSVRCTSPPSCVSSFSIEIPVLASAFSTVAPNSLLAVKAAAAVDLSWTGTGSGFNVAATGVRASLPTLWTAAPLNPAPLATASYSDAPPPAAVVMYRAFGTYACNGRSVP